jgi:replicative DNA helicase
MVKSSLNAGDVKDQDRYFIELEILFASIKHKNKFLGHVNFLNKEYFIYFSEAFEYVKDHHIEPVSAILSDLISRKLISKEDLDLFDQIVPDESDLKITRQYADWLQKSYKREKALNALQKISLSKNYDLESIYKSLKNIIDEISISTSSSSILGIEDMYNEFTNDQKKPETYRFGFRFTGRSLDDYVYDMIPGNTIVIGARPGIGKTLLSIHVALSHAIEDTPVHMISFEMTKAQIFGRLISMVSKIPAHKIFKKQLDEDDLETIRLTTESMKTWPLYFTSTSDGNIESIESLIRRSVYENGTKMFIIDYLQLMSNPRFFGNRHLEIGSIAQKLKTLAIELDTCIIEISQLSRKLNEEPEIDDLKESGDIEQAASMIALLSNIKDEKIDDNGVVKRYIKLAVKKQRNGPLFSSVVSYDTRSFDFTAEELTLGISSKKRSNEKSKNREEE